ncbi:MAG TPA: DUF2254 domain-containing protein [Azospirillaceae bacterium]|nr:DUF2254 domain-containing protein [Azospirillaceae bacterium]
MLDRFYTFWERLRTSLWFVPVMMVLVGIALAVALLQTDNTVLGLKAGAVWWLHSGRAEDARELLSTLLTSVITMTSLVFSMTLVVLTLAANQFGSRLIRIFMADRTTQSVLGVFMMTIVYCLLVLRAIANTDGDRVPHLAVTAGTALALASLFLLIAFIHNIGRSIKADTVVRRVAAELDDAIARLLPAGGDHDADEEREPEKLLPADFAHRAGAVCLEREGYIQAIEYEELAELGQRFSAVVQVDIRAGDFVIAGAQAIRVWPADAATPEVLAGIDSAILIGQSRTPVQDIEFPIRHLVEVAVRALSPGINDPFTAMAVVDRLGAGLARLMGRAFHPRVFRDSDGSVRVVAKAPVHGELIDAAFHQIRQAGARMPAVIIRMLDTLARIGEFAKSPHQRKALMRHARLVAEAGMAEDVQSADREAIEQRFTAVCAILSQPHTSAFAVLRQNHHWEETVGTRS